MNEQFKRDIYDAHRKAWTAAVTKLPDIDINVLIQLICDVAMEKIKPEDAAKQLASEGKAAFKTYVKVFTEIAGENLLKHLLQSSSKTEVQNLSETDFSKRMVKCSEKIQHDISLYMNQKIDAAEFIERLGKTDLVSLIQEFAKASDIDLSAISDSKELMQIYQQIGNSALMEMSIVACTAAYVILMNTLHEAHQAHIEDERIIAQCNESTRQIVEYRNSLNRQVNKYLNEHLEVFEKGFAAMDEALMNDDSSQYIAGNAEIQNALGRYAQFWDQESFDKLMASDAPFKL